MTRKDFQQYLSNPELLDARTLPSLEKLVQEFPYFQAGRMLYLKNLHNENSIDYEKQLQITTAYVSGGKVLYGLIRRRSKSAPAVPIESHTEVVKSAASEVKSGKGNEILPRMEPVVVLREIQISATSPPSKEELRLPEELEKEILSEAYRLTAEHSLEATHIPEKVELKPAITKQKKTIPDSVMPLSGEHTFSDWLRIISGETPPSVAEEKVRLKEQKDQLIDGFIASQSADHTPRQKAEFYSAEGMAKKSLEDNEVFVSETLAGIYLKQGNLPKALRAYEILLVKYPEKIHIFAPLLEKIKKLQEGIKGK